MKKIENAKRKNGYKSYPKTLVEAVFWDKEKKPLEEVLDGIQDDKISYPDAGSAGQVLALDGSGKPEWVDAAEGGTYDGALSDSSTNAPQNKVVTAKLSELGQEVLNNYFTGAGQTFVATQINGLVPGRTYRVVLKDSNWDMTGITGTSNYRFSIHSYYNNASTALVLVRVGSSVAPYYDITIPANSDYVRLGGRAVSGVRVEFNIFDLMYGLELRGLLDEYKLQQKGDFSTIRYRTAQTSNYQYCAIPTGALGAVSLVTIYSATSVTGPLYVYKNPALGSSGQVLVHTITDGLTANVPYSFVYDVTDTQYNYLRITGIPATLDFDLTFDKYIVKGLPELQDVTKTKTITKSLSLVSAGSKYATLPFTPRPGVNYRVKINLQNAVTDTPVVLATKTQSTSGQPTISALPNTAAQTDIEINVVFPGDGYKYLWCNSFSDSGLVGTISYDVQDLNSEDFSNALQIELGIGTSILGENPLSEKAFSNLGLVNAYGQTNNVFTIAHITDTHGDNVNVARFNEYCDFYGANLDERINTGDIVNQTFDYHDYYENDLYEDTLLVLGNHDVLSWDPDTQTSHIAYVGLPAFNRFIAPNYVGWGVTLAPDAATYGYSWYYKDFAAKKIRLIVLDDTNLIEAQRTWLQARLAETLDSNDAAYGYSVIIAQHYIPAHSGDVTSFIPSTFTSLFGTTPPPNVFPTDVAQWQASGGKFLAWLVGHTHRDYIGKIAVNVSGVDYQQVFICAAGGAQYASTQDMARARGKKSEDCFNIYGFDTTNKVIKVFRVGADQDLWMRTKYTACIKYEAAELISVY